MTDLEVGLTVKVGDEECKIVRKLGTTYVVERPDGSSKAVTSEQIEPVESEEEGSDED